MKKQKTKLEEKSVGSMKSEEEKEVLTESDSNSSNWITESEATVSRDTVLSDSKTTSESQSLDNLLNY